MGGHGTGVGVGGGKGLLSYLQQVSEAGVIQVGDVRQDIVLLQFRNQLLAEVGQAVLADVAEPISFSPFQVRVMALTPSSASRRTRSRSPARQSRFLH